MTLINTTRTALVIALAAAGLSAQAQTMSTTPVPGAAGSGLSVGEGQPTPPAAPGTRPSRGHGDHHRGMIQRIDLDRDGQISRNELVAAHQKQLQAFDAADTNRDGKLSAEEMQVFQQQMRGQKRQG
jgi:hypothetical protein